MKKIVYILILFIIISFASSCNNKETEELEDENSELKEEILDWFKEDNQYDMDAWDYISNNMTRSSSDHKLHFNDIDWTTLPEDDYNWHRYIKRTTKNVYYINKNGDVIDLIFEFIQNNASMHAHLKFENNKISDIKTNDDYIDYFDSLELSDITYYYSNEVDTSLSKKEAANISDKVFDRLKTKGYDINKTSNDEVVKKYKNAKLIDSLIFRYSSDLSAKNNNNLLLPDVRLFTCLLIIQTSKGYEILNVIVNEAGVSYNDPINYYEYAKILSNSKDLDGNYFLSDPYYSAIVTMYVRTNYLLEEYFNNNSSLLIKDNDGSIHEYSKTRSKKLIFDNRNGEEIYGANIYKGGDIATTQSGTTIFTILSNSKLNINNISDILTYDEERYANIEIYYNEEYKLNNKFVYTVYIEHTNRKLDIKFNGSLNNIEIFEISYHKNYVTPSTYVKGLNIVNSEKLWLISEVISFEELYN